MLTDAQCRNFTCPPDKKRARLTDSGGLYLEASPAGSRRWFAKLYTNGKETRIALGSYPSVGLPAARRARDLARAQKAQGHNPIQARRVDRLNAMASGSDTFEAAASEWIAQRHPVWSESHFIRESRNLKKDLLPWLGPRPIGEVTPIELLDVIRRVEQRGVSDVPRRVLLTARGVWQFAVATGRAQRDITGDIQKALKPHTKHNQPAIVDPHELRELLLASDGYHGGPVVRCALQIAALLFQRPGNLRMMRWADVDLKRALWTIPSADLKRRIAEKINGQPHVVPLPRQAVALLKDLQPLTGNREYVFPGVRDPRRPMSEAAVNAALHSMGYKGRHCWHGYRATGRTILRQVLGYPADVIEAQLAHKGQITHGGAYDRATFQKERAKMLQEWANYLDKLRTGANVVKLRKA